jgi:hypothetical protein
MEIRVAGSATRREQKKSPLFEIALVLVRLNHVAGCIVKRSHGYLSIVAQGR